MFNIATESNMWAGYWMANEKLKNVSCYYRWGLFAFQNPNIPSIWNKILGIQLIVLMLWQLMFNVLYCLMPDDLIQLGKCLGVAKGPSQYLYRLINPLTAKVIFYCVPTSTCILDNFIQHQEKSGSTQMVKWRRCYCQLLLLLLKLACFTDACKHTMFYQLA